MAEADQDDFVVAGNQKEPEPVVEAAAAAVVPAAEPVVPASEPAEAEPAAEPIPASEAAKPLQAPKKKTVQQRIDELTFQKHEAERRAAALEQELQRRHEPAAQPQAAAPGQATRPKPALEAFAGEADPYAAWQEAVVDWKLEQREAARQAATAAEVKQQAEAQAKLAEEQAKQQYIIRVQSFADQHEDYDAVVTPYLSSAFVPPAMGQAILQSERGPEILYWLAQHSTESTELAMLAAPQGRDSAGLIQRLLESRLDPARAGSGSSVPSTSAKPPIRPVGSSPVVATDGPPDDTADLDAHAAYYNRLDREAMKRRP